MAGTEIYRVPRGDGSEPPLKIDLVEVLKDQVRLQEVAIVTTHKAPELLSAFNRSWLKLKSMHTRLVYEKATADAYLKEVRAEVRLGLNDDAVKERGFAKSSADLRDALVEVDQRTKDARERLNQISAAVDFIGGKMKAFENGYTAVKRILATTPMGAPVKTFRDQGDDNIKDGEPGIVQGMFGSVR